MKKYIKEMIILILQLLLFFFFPLVGGPTDVIAVVLLMLCITVIFGLFVGILSRNPIKWLYSIATAIIFLPTIPIYYNESALVHALWYLVASLIGLAPGAFIRWIAGKLKN